MRKFCSRLTAAFLCLCLVIPLAVSAAGLDQFTKKHTYSSKLFSDVPSAWYYDSVKTCYELGLMSGYTDKTFRPDGNITLAECIVIAARVHNLYRSGLGVFDQSGSPWYDIPVKYAISSKIIKSTDFADYTKNATRAQMAYIFSSPLPSSELKAINKVDAVPDVAAGDAYSDAIYLLYRAGVLTGRGEEGYFDPDKAITRAEAAAIISRLVVPANRKTFTLKPVTPAVDPVDPSTSVDPPSPVDPSAGNDDFLSGDAFRFSDAQSFSEGFAVVSHEGGFDYIGTDGKMLTQAGYAAAYPFSEGKGVVLTARTGGGFALGYVDRDGRYSAIGGITLGPGLPYTGTGGVFSEGFLLLDGAAPALVDASGAFFPVSGSAAVVSAPGDGLILLNAGSAGGYPRYRYVDSAGRTVIELPAAGDLASGAGDAVIEAGAFHHGMAPVRVGSFAGGKLVSSSWGFIDLTGSVVVSGLASQASAFESGVSTGVLQNGSVPVIITASGSVIRLTNYSTVFSPSADSALIAVVKNGKYGFVSKTGAEVIAPRFIAAQPFSGGLAAAAEGGKHGFIDEAGEWAFSPLYDEVRSFSDGFGWGKTGGVWYILER